MDIGGIIGKIESNADKLGVLVGALSGLREHAWGKDVFQGINVMINGLINDPHIPDLSHVWYHLNYPANKTFRTALGAAVLGYLLKEVDIDPKINRLGNALSKGGWGVLMGVLGVNVLIYSGAGHSEGANHGLGGGSHVGFLSGDRHNPHGHYTEPSIAPYGTNLTRSTAGSPGPYQ